MSQSCCKVFIWRLVNVPSFSLWFSVSHRQTWKCVNKHTFAALNICQRCSCHFPALLSRQLIHCWYGWVPLYSWGFMWRGPLLTPPLSVFCAPPWETQSTPLIGPRCSDGDSGTQEYILTQLHAHKCRWSTWNRRGCFNNRAAKRKLCFVLWADKANHKLSKKCRQQKVSDFP